MAVHLFTAPGRRMHDSESVVTDVGCACDEGAVSTLRRRGKSGVSRETG